MFAIKSFFAGLAILLCTGAAMKEDWLLVIASLLVIVLYVREFHYNFLARK
jgi:hypothetical protein